MNEQKKLTISMTIFCFIIFVAFGVIIVTEKTSTFLTPKVKDNLTKYLYDKYPSIKNDIEIKDVTYKNTIYTMKIESKSNKNLYFYIKYDKKKITDTYKKDYLEGKIFLTHISNNINKEIKDKTKKNYKISINTNLNDFVSSTKEKVLKEENLSNIRIYNLEKNILINNWSTETISNEIKTFINEIEKQNITPKTYTFIITDKNKKLKISNITYKTIENKLYNQIINDIINNNNSELLKKQNIKYQYMN